MTTYDFNTTYSPLPVHNQGQEGVCWDYAHGLGVIAAHRMRGEVLDWVDPNHPTFTYTDRYTGDISGVTHTIHPLGTVPRDRVSLTAFLDDAGFTTLAVTMPYSLYVWNSPSLPVVHPSPGDEAVSGHDMFVAGYTDDGLIVQNSWGPTWGFHGRAVLSWDWLAQFCTDVSRESYDDYPVSPRPAPPVLPTPAPSVPISPKDVRMLVRFAGNDAVYEVVGSHLEHVTAQAYHARSNPPVTDLPANHPLSALPRT